MTAADPGVYAFQRITRRPFIVAALLASMGLFYTGVVIGAPTVILILWGLASAALLVAVAVNRRAGIRIDGGTLAWYAGPRREQVALSDILRVTVTRWTDGPGEWVIETKTGQRLTLPDAAVPIGSALGEALRDRGVTIEDRRLKGTTP